jgi:hypothetical protein
MAGKISRVSRTFIAVFIDLRTACDNINRRRLYGILAQQGIAKKILDWKEGVCQTMAQVKVLEALQRYLNYIVDEISTVDRRHCCVLWRSTA